MWDETATYMKILLGGKDKRRGMCVRTGGLCPEFGPKYEDRKTATQAQRSIKANLRDVLCEDLKWAELGSFCAFCGDG
jgi:hypothetical protein